MLQFQFTHGWYTRPESNGKTARSFTRTGDGIDRENLEENKTNGRVIHSRVFITYGFIQYD